MELYFVRHGQTDFNVAGRLQGQEVDAPLNATGIAQVEAAAENLPQGVTKIFSSPLKRAYQSAEIISKKLGIPIITSDAIKEMRFGTIAGKTWKEVESETGETGLEEEEDSVEYDYRRFGGETSDDMKKRVKNFVEQLRSECPDDVVLVVAHGGVIQAMHVLYPQKEIPAFENASIHEFVF